RRWRSIEMMYCVTLCALFLISSFASVICIFVFDFPHWVVVVIVVGFVISVALLTIALGVIGQRRRMIRRVRRHHLMHGRHDIYTISSLFYPPPPGFPPHYTEQMRIPRPTLLRTSRLLSMPPQYEQLFGSSRPFSPPPPGAPPSYASMDRPRRNADRSSFSPPPGYEERRQEEEMRDVEERIRSQSVVIEIDEELIEDNNNESQTVATAVMQIIDCSKEIPQLFEIPQQETIC
ncbi:hypothetical protein PMAYCL1PPCAC_30964, partial [Pristionchus mayeri]